MKTLDVEDSKATPVEDVLSIRTIRENKVNIQRLILFSTGPANVGNIVDQLVENFKNSLNRYQASV